MTRWSEAQVLKVAPDQASVTAARRLARPGSWSGTGSTEILLWGRCQGSGKVPYQVSVDLTGPAFRCSCPSRKFPCKHALALMLLWVAGSGSVTEVDRAADFAQEWADDRSGRAAGRTSKAAEPAAPDPVAQARRREERVVLMSAGLDDFGRWLSDLVRFGTAAARQQPYAWWDAAAARLVDSQLPGLAEQVRALASDVHRRDDWAEHLLAVCGRWWTATQAWTRSETLSTEAVADLRTHLGWAQPGAEVREADSGAGRFLVLGAHRTDDGRLQQQRTWLRDDETGEVFQVLDFAAAGAALPVPQLAGAVVDATISRFPGSAPRRARVTSPSVPSDRPGSRPARITVDEALAVASSRLGAAPWADRVPVVLGGVVVQAVGVGTAGWLRDAEGHRLDLVEDTALWLLLAHTGGAPADLFGELDAGGFRPLTLLGDDGMVAL